MPYYSKIIVSSCVVLVCLSTMPAYAKMNFNTVGGYDDAKTTSLPILMTYLFGAGNALITANSALELNKEHPLFCMPADLMISREGFLKIFQDELKQLEKRSSLKDLSEADDALILYSGLKNRFPCDISN